MMETYVMSVGGFQFYSAESTPFAVVVVVDGVVSDGHAILARRVPADDGPAVRVLGNGHVLRRVRYRTCTFPNVTVNIFRYFLRLGGEWVSN